MRLPATLALVILVGPLLAGCIDPLEAFQAQDGAAGPPAGAHGRHRAPLAPSAAPAANTGTVRVLALTPDLDPVAEADVAVGGNSTGKTAQDGRITIPGIPAGNHSIVVSKQDWRSARLHVHVAAGSTTDVEAKLLPTDQADGLTPPTDQVYSAEYDFVGAFECSATYLIITGDCLLVADFVLNETLGLPLRPGDNTEDHNAFEFPLDGGWKSVVVEMRWEAPLAPLGEKMQLALEPAEAPEDGHAAKYARVTGGSPLAFTVQRGTAHDTASESADGEQPDMPNPAGGEVVTARAYVLGEAHNPGGTTFLGIGAAYGQRFEVFVTVFYGEAAPDGFSRMP